MKGCQYRDKWPTIVTTAQVGPIYRQIFPVIQWILVLTERVSLHCMGLI